LYQNAYGLSVDCKEPVIHDTDTNSSSCEKGYWLPNGKGTKICKPCNAEENLVGTDGVTCTSCGIKRAERGRKAPTRCVDSEDSLEVKKNTETNKDQEKKLDGIHGVMYDMMDYVPSLIPLRRQFHAKVDVPFAEIKIKNINKQLSNDKTLTSCEKEFNSHKAGIPTLLTAV
jgi:hypothetical protein